MLLKPQHFQDLFQRLPSPIVVIRNEEILLVNEASHALFLELGIVCEVADILDIFSLKRAYKKIVSGQEKYTTQQVKVKPIATGSTQYFEVSIANRTMGQDTVVIIQFQNTTQLVQAENMRSDFVANVSHELRTPLTSILGFSEILLDDTSHDTDTGQAFLKTMYDESMRMKRVLDDLLVLARIEQIEHIRPTEPVCLKNALYAVMDSLPVQKQDYHFSIDISEDGDTQVIGIRDALIQVLQNLITNAMKYSPPHSNITIRMKSSILYDVPAVSVSISDEGEGIDAKHIPRLTERFYRVDKARSRAVGGTGLGLAIVKHILNQHRGTLNITSAMNVGSAFTITIPKFMQDTP